MTPFEKAGYTRDSKFRVMRDTFRFVEGDTVWLYRDDGGYMPLFTNGRSVIKLTLPDACSDPRLELIVNDEPVYPNPPQKHKDVIIEWAKGAEIEYRYQSEEWCSVSTPLWRSEMQYRVKPQTSDKEARIKKLELELLVAEIKHLVDLLEV
jgi:hypothetical protein